ncbi:MAG TPA: hypothetical protein VMU61_08345 [Candidatus Aquilonibacter sp.]|nr:hypothetical protein [Candidatus Aquilonibacter sp.]
MRRFTTLVICLLALALCAGSALASTTPPPADTLKIDYFSNANTAGAPDGTVRITNPGTSGGNLWAAIYVFDPNQELTECCECLLTPDGLRTLSVNSDLTGNPLTGVTLSTGVIKTVSTTGVNAARLYPVAAIRSWGTHIQNSNFAVTETASQDATFSAAEQARLQAECAAIELDGSGKGICSCGTGE